MRQLQILTLVLVTLVLFISSYFIFNKQTDLTFFKSESSNEFIPNSTNNEVKEDKVIMGFMGNKTEKAELGRATWKFLHTMMARYPETPTKEERKSLFDFMMLFSTLYPCGECATHFNKLITEFPPQTSSRFAASQWLCGMHNKVNERLHKPIFECNDLESKYPCGCAED